MFKFVDNIPNVMGLKCIKGDVYYTEKNILKLNYETLVQGVEGYSFWPLAGGIYFFHIEGGKFLRKDGLDYKVDSPLFIGTDHDQKIFCRTNFRRENRKWCWRLGVFDLVLFKVIKEIQFENFTVDLVINNVGIGYFDKQKISAFDVEKGRIIWELAFEQFGSLEIKEFLGVYQKQLLLACSNHLLLSVDVYNGEIQYKWRELVGFEAGQFYKDVLPEPTDFVLDKEAGKLIGVFSKYYFEIDLETGQISYEDVSEELNNHHINSFRRMGSNQFTKDHLFVTAHAELDKRPNVDLDCVLALNRNTKKVDWVHIFQDTGLGTNVPQITSTHLYQLDTEHNLYVFEKVS